MGLRRARADALVAALSAVTTMDALEPEPELGAAFAALLADEGSAHDWGAVAFAADTVPDRQAMAGPDAARWLAAKQAEVDALVRAGTWELLPRSAVPAGRRVLRVLWVLRPKYDAQGALVKYKARLCVDGSGQQAGVDLVQYFAPVVQQESVRVVCALAAQHNWVLRHVDIDNAFCQTAVDEEVYVQQPPGFEQRGARGEQLVCRLRRSLYGLRQSPRNFNIALVNHLTQQGFSVAPTDPCVIAGLHDVIVLIYVDDIIITGTCDAASIDSVVAAIRARFPVKDLGELGWFLGIGVTRNASEGVLELCQRRYVTVILRRFGMEDCSSVDMPAHIGNDLQQGELLATADARLFRTYVGALLYISTGTRPDIAFAVSHLARYMAAPRAFHMVAAKRVLRYLHGHPHGLVYRRQPGPSHLLAYADASYASDLETRRSTTGWVVLLSGAAVAWRSKLQPIVTTSSTEAEYVALCAAALAVVALRALLAFLGFDQQLPTIIYEDNTAALQLSVNPIAQQRTKHIDVRYHKLRELVAERAIDVVSIRTTEQLADLLTKALGRVAHERLAPRVLGTRFWR
jgi:histone deacetylase 1/2